MKVKLLLCLSFVLMLGTSLALSAVTIKTNSIRYVGLDTAISGGNILNTGGEQIIEAGVCWSTNPQPTVNDGKTIRSSATDSFTCIIRNLLPERGYYVRAYAKTSSGTFYGPQRTFATDKIVLGTLCKGGYLFYVLNPGDPGYVANEFHGFVVCTQIINPTLGRFTWANRIDTFLNVTDTSLFTGEGNTLKIVTALGPGQYAAWMCYDLNFNGYSDWFLPSKNELQLLIKSKVQATPQTPWSSSEVSAGNAYQVITSKKDKISSKTTLAKVIAIRKF